MSDLKLLKIIRKRQINVSIVVNVYNNLQKIVGEVEIVFFYDIISSLS